MHGQLFHKAIHLADTAICQTDDAFLDKSTPCTEWDVRALLNHIVYETAWVAPLVEGKTIAEVGDKFDGDMLGDNPVESWRKYAAIAVEAVRKASPDSVAHLSYGDKSVADYLDEVGSDLIIHGWDLAKSLGVTYIIDDRTADEVMDATGESVKAAKDSGLFAPPLATSDNASKAEVLLACYGRDINWKP